MADIADDGNLFEELVKEARCHILGYICALNFWLQLTEAANGARSDDIGSLVHDGLEYIALDLPSKVLEPRIPIKQKKDISRGFKHPVLARLLCPVKYLANFDADPKE
jgi:hypothetical protein